MCDPRPPLPPEDFFLTVAGEAACEVKIKRSRFIGLVAPVCEATAVRSWVEVQEKRYHDARHVCFGWLLCNGTATTENRSDAGEPSGTAGEPILAALRKVDVSDAVVVVVRYFGGIKLGTGGLSRAYGEAAGTVLEQAGTRVVRLGRDLALDFPYDQRKTLDYLLQQCRGRIRDESYTEQISWRIWLPHSQYPKFLAMVREATAGSVVPREFPEDRA